ncbi:MAG: glycosyltransferase family A protein [bacterium]
MISVVIPLYNKEEFIAKTIESVLAQTFQDFEIVVVNDGSTDGSVNVVESIRDNRIRILHQENGGVSVARNNGIEQSKYEWVALLDGDDIWKPEYLQTQWNLHLKYPSCDVCACNYEFCDHNGNVTPTKINKLPFSGEDGILSNYFEVASCSHPPICSISIMAKRSAFLAVGGFPVGVTNGEDLLTWARLAVQYKIAYNRIRQVRYMMKVKSVPVNIPKGNIVGEQLEKLLKHNPCEVKIKQYIGLWYKIRANIYLCGGYKLTAIKHIFKSLRFRPADFKLYVYLILCFFPGKIIRGLLKIKSL